MKEKMINSLNKFIQHISNTTNNLLNKYNINTITLKLTLGISTIVFICTFIIGILFITQYKELSIKKVEDDIIKNSEQLSSFGDMILSNNNIMPNPNFFKSLRRITNADFWVISSNGDILASTVNIFNDSMEEVKSLNKTYIKQLNNNNIITYDYSSLLKIKTLTVITPIYSGQFLKGAIILHNNVNEIYNSNAHLTTLVIASLIISLILSIIMGIIYSKHFTKPIKNITEITKKIANRDYNVKTNITRQDEIGELASTIDQMTLEINKNITEITDLEKRAKDLVANVSHEFKTPLTLIRGYTENLKNNVTKPNKEVYEKILNNTITLEKLVNELLDLSKFQSGKVILNKEKLELKQLLKSIINDMKSLAKNKNIKINIIELYKKQQIIEADYIKIKQLFTIFLDNAIKYSKESSSIEIIINENSVTISDSGIGIEQNKLEQIFERYYQVDNNNKGYGLGLCIAKYIADAHNYQITINSIENVGTNVTINFSEI